MTGFKLCFNIVFFIRCQDILIHSTLTFFFRKNFSSLSVMSLSPGTQNFLTCFINLYLPIMFSSCNPDLANSLFSLFLPDCQYIQFFFLCSVDYHVTLFTLRHIKYKKKSGKFNTNTFTLMSLWEEKYYKIVIIFVKWYPLRVLPKKNFK